MPKKPIDKKRKDKPVVKSHHFIFIEAPIEDVAPEVMLWSDSQWWPKESVICFASRMEGPLQVGMQATMKLLMPLAANTDTNITEVAENKFFERKFVSGLMLGKENISLEGRNNGTRVDYNLEYRINGLWNNILWTFFFKVKYFASVKLIMESLKNYILNARG